MDDYEDEDDGVYLVTEAAPSYKLHWPAIAAHFVGFAGNVCSAGSVLFQSIAREVAGHANYMIDRDQFAAEAGRELESLLNEGED